MRIGAPQILKALAFGLGALAAIAAAIEFSDVIGPNRAERAAAESEGNAPGSILARCRTLAPEDHARATDCRAAWEAARQRFFDPAPEPAGAE